MEFKVDTIVSSVRELAKEKREKEKTLSELCLSRTQLQKRLENVTYRHIRVSSRWSKSIETVKVTEQKMIELESLINHYELVTNKKRQMIQKLNSNLIDEEFIMQQLMNQFEKNIGELTDKFRSGVHIYSEDTLQDEVETISYTKQVLLEKMQKDQLLLEALKEKLCDMKLKVIDKMKNQEVIIDDKTGAIIRNMCCDEYQFHKIQNKRKVRKHKALLKAATSLEEKLKGLQQNL